MQAIPVLNFLSGIVWAIVIGSGIGALALLAWIFKLRFLNGIYWTIIGVMLIYGFTIFIAAPFFGLLVMLFFGYIIYWMVRYLIRANVHNTQAYQQQRLDRAKNLLQRFANVVSEWANRITVPALQQAIPLPPQQPQPAPVPQPAQQAQPQQVPPPAQPAPQPQQVPAQPAPAPAPQPLGISQEILRGVLISLLQAVRNLTGCHVAYEEDVRYVVTGTDGNKRQAAIKNLREYITADLIPDLPIEEQDNASPPAL